MADIAGIRQRNAAQGREVKSGVAHGLEQAQSGESAAGPINYGKPKELLRAFLFGLYFVGSCLLSVGSIVPVETANSY